jgi:hypothetical protein
LVKVNPIADWTTKQVWRYLHEHGVPYNPLHDKGYPSIGCTHCTRAIQPGEDPRAGRWPGTAKTECGLHIIEIDPIETNPIEIKLIESNPPRRLPDETAETAGRTEAFGWRNGSPLR